MTRGSLHVLKEPEILGLKNADGLCKLQRFEGARDVCDKEWSRIIELSDNAMHCTT